MKRSLFSISTPALILTLMLFTAGCALFQGGECDCQKFGEVYPDEEPTELVDEATALVEKH